MGSWSYEIMGGDTPYDFMSLIKQIVGIKWEDDNEAPHLFTINPRLLEEKQDQLIQEIEKDKYDPEIGLQVLAYLMMFNGAQMTGTSKLKMLKAVEEDEWAKEEIKRKTEIDNFLIILQKYDASGPVDLKHKGLFETIEDYLNDDNDPELTLNKE